MQVFQVNLPLIKISCICYKQWIYSGSEEVVFTNVWWDSFNYFNEKQKAPYITFSQLHKMHLAYNFTSQFTLPYMWTVIILFSSNLNTNLLFKTLQHMKLLKFRSNFQLQVLLKVFRIQLLRILNFCTVKQWAMFDNFRELYTEVSIKNCTLWTSRANSRHANPIFSSSLPYKFSIDTAHNKVNKTIEQ